MKSLLLTVLLECLSVVVLLLIFCGLVSAQEKLTYLASYPAGPDETVLIQGQMLDENTEIVVKALKDAKPGKPMVFSPGKLLKKMGGGSSWLKVKTIQPNGLDIKFVIPKKFKEGMLPIINDWEGELKKYKGLTIIYSIQCPWVARFIEEVKPILKEKNMNPSIRELKSHREAQKAPSLYSVFNLIYNGKLLADRYISTTRFKNIINKELQV